jgi:emp24/gp25L/p24 family/GOLD
MSLFILLQVLTLTKIVSSQMFSSLSLQVEPKVEECFIETIPQNMLVDASVLVWRGGKLDVKLRIESPSNQVLFDKLLYSNLDDTTGGFLNTVVKKGHTFSSSVGGDYRFCLDNRMAKWTAKVATLEIEITDPSINAVGDYGLKSNGRVNGAESDDANDINSAVSTVRLSAQRVHHKLFEISNEQHYHNQREQRHRFTVDSTNSSLLYWSLSETIVVVLTMILQGYIVKRWFSAMRQLPGGLL